jgi:hypothetical protein
MDPINPDQKKNEADKENDTSADQKTPTRWARFKERVKIISLFEWLMLIFTAVIATSTSIYTCYSAGQWRIMRDQLHLSQRPWVGIREPIIIDKPLTFDSQGALIIIRVEMENAGTSPANWVFPIVDMNLGDTLDEVIRKQEQVCSWHATTTQQFGPMMLPNRKVTTEPINILVNWPKIRLDKKGDTFVWLVGCLRYLDQFKILHKTRILYTYATATESWFKPQGTVSGEFKQYFLGNSAD